MQLSENQPETQIPTFDVQANAVEPLPPNKALYSQVSCKLEGVIYDNRYQAADNSNSTILTSNIEPLIAPNINPPYGFYIPPSIVTGKLSEHLMNTKGMRVYLLVEERYSNTL